MEAAELAGYTRQEFIGYEKDMATELDRKLALEFAGQKGVATTSISIASNLKAMGIPAEQIAGATGLGLNEIELL